MLHYLHKNRPRVVSVEGVAPKQTYFSMGEYRYILQPYKGINTRYDCPDCGKRKSFSRYLDTETGEHINHSVGMCNRLINCGYHYTPKQYFQDNPGASKSNKIEFLHRYARTRARARDEQNPVSFIDTQVFKETLKGYEANHFVTFLISTFGVEVTSQLISRYFIGTSKHWPGATVFWQIDKQGLIRTGKIMLYSPTTGKRVKEPLNCIAWAHGALTQPRFELRQCLFGEHLLKLHPARPVAIVESEKTAVIASAYLPRFNWLAVGSLTELKAVKCQVLKARPVILFPDLNGLDKWSDKAKELSNITRFNVSDLLERNATEAERKQGLDLADYLIRINYREFIAQEPIKQLSHCPNPEPLAKSSLTTKNLQQTAPAKESTGDIAKSCKNWITEIAELETYFKSITMPTQPIKLNQCSTITNVAQFIENHLITVKTYAGNQTFLPYLERLQQLKKVL
jgi:hypothetical protein